MRKLINISTVLVASLLCISTVAQEQGSSNVLQSKNGHTILPESGDYVLGFNAVPVLNFALNAVNIMNNTGHTAQHPGYVTGFGQTLVGKYFTSSTSALRLKLAINTATVVNKTFGNDPFDTSPVPENILLQTNKNMNNAYLLGLGIENRRGHNRLQGFYGAELLLGANSNKVVNKYQIDYDAASAAAGFMASGANRILVNNAGTAFTVGVRAFTGVEYFVLPKISIGAEFGWALGVVTNPRGRVKTENWGIEPTSTSATDYQFITDIKGNNSGRNVNFGVDNGISNILGNSAALSILFHF